MVRSPPSVSGVFLWYDTFATIADQLKKIAPDLTDLTDCSPLATSAGDSRSGVRRKRGIIIQPPGTMKGTKRRTSSWTRRQFRRKSAEKTKWPKELESRYKILHRLYYTPRNPASFGGVNNLHREALKQIGPGISIKEVREFAYAQLPYVMHFPVRRRFNQYRQIVAKKIDDVWVTDLIFFDSIKRQNRGFSILMLVQDVLSSYVISIFPLKSKKSLDVSKAFRQIFETTGRRPEKLFSDLGTEYYGNTTQNTLKEFNVQLYSVSTPRKSSIAEHLAKMVKSILGRYMTAQQKFTYVDILEDVRMSLNDRYNSVIKTSASAVTKKNQQEIFERKYKNIKSKSKYKFAVGDFCRIVTSNMFRKVSRHSVSRLRFKVLKILPTTIHTYQIGLAESGEKTNRIFYSPELIIDRTDGSVIPKPFPVLARAI